MDNESTRALPEGASKLADKISASKYLMNGEFGERFTDAERNEIIAALRIAPHPAPEASKLADEHNAYGYAKRLAESLWERHWKNVAPDWKPLPDLIGVLTQIDNMTAGLAASRPMPGREPVAWRWRNCGSPEWVYQASVPINKHPDRLEIEPLFTQSGEQQS